MNEEEQIELKSLLKLTKATPHQASRVFHYYTKYINPRFIGCLTCPESVRTAFRGIKEHIW